MKILGISDLHQKTPSNLPKADVLVIAGDYSFLPKSSRYQPKVMLNELKHLNNYLKTISHKFKHIVFTPGNHDWVFETNEKLARQTLDQAIVLINEEVVLDGVKFYGSPVTPAFCNWAFNVERGVDIRKYWDQIPYDTDILITHGPPHGVLDQVFPRVEHLGCEELADAVNRIMPKAHFFGHVHSGCGQQNLNGIEFCNCSVVGEDYQQNGYYCEVLIES
ncbi:MAG: metallophosphoesterase family protein [Candidatus Hodarchaeales archaeon]